MKIELSKTAKIITFSAIAVAAFALGVFLECCDKKEFEITTVPLPSQDPEVAADYESHYDEDGRLDINMADIAELDELNGIGEKMAQRIIDYREANGPFHAVEELTLVNGIGQSLLERIQDKICVR